MFLAFAQDNSTKITAKLRGASTKGDQFDVVAELEFVYLIAPHILNIEYEPWSRNKRAPDFRLEIDKSSHVAVEISRIRQTPAAAKCYGQPVAEIPYTQKESFKFTDIIFNKLKQLKANIPNIIFIRSNSDTHEDFEVLEALDNIDDRYKFHDIKFFQDKGYTTLDDFQESFARLSAIVCHDGWTLIPGNNSKTSTQNQGRENPAAKHPIPKKFFEILLNIGHR